MSTVRIQLRRGSASEWAAADAIGDGVVLAPGEVGFITDENTFKVGDGETQFGDLPYILESSLGDYIPMSQFGTPSGVATLDSNGILNTSQLPALAKVTVASAADQSARLALTAEPGDIAIQADNGQSYVLKATPASTDSNWQALVGSEAVVDTVEAALVAGTGLDKTYNDTTGTITIDIDSTVATKTYADTAAAEAAADAVAGIISTAPATLDTLAELASALGEDANFSATVTTSIATKLPKSGGSMTGNIAMGGSRVTGLATPVDADDAATKQFAEILASDAVQDSQEYTLSEISNHNSDSTTVHGIADTALLATKEYADDAVSAHNDVTTNIHGIADTADLATETYVNDAVSAHNLDTTSIHGISDTANLVYAADLSGHTSDTTDVHGIADTSLLATQEYVNDALDSEITDRDAAITTAIGTEVNDRNSAIGTAVSTHNSDTTDVHGIADTANLVYTSDSRLSDERTPTDLSVTTGKIADDAVTGAKIADNAISQSHMSDDSVGTNEIGGLAVTTAKIADGAVTTEKIATGAVTKSMVGLANVDNTTDADKPVSTATQTSLDAKLSLAGGTMTGALTLSADPSSSLHAATKQYVDNTASGVIAKPQVLGATTANIDATYNNGTAGVGATLTHNTNGAFPAESGGASGWAVGKGILVKNQTNKAQNGRYYVSDMGSPSTPYVLTRCGYCDEASEIPGAYIFVQDGTSAGTGWIQVVADPATFVVGTDNIDVFQFSGSGTITAGTGITVSGNEVSISDGAITSSLILDGTIVNADVNASAEIAQSKIANLTTDLGAKAPKADPTFTGTLTVSASGIAFTDGTQTKQGVPSLTTIASATTGAYNLSTGGLSLRDQLIPIGGTHAITVPTNTTTAFPVGTSISFYQSAGTGGSFAAADGTVTILSTPGATLRALYSSATLTKVATNTWLLAGDLKV